LKTEEKNAEKRINRDKNQKIIAKIWKEIVRVHVIFDYKNKYENSDFKMHFQRYNFPDFILFFFCGSLKRMSRPENRIIQKKENECEK
jgi:hypothetical protein